MDEEMIMNSRGQTAIEYVLVAVLIALLIIIAFHQTAIDNAIYIAGDNIQNSLVVEE